MNQSSYSESKSYNMKKDTKEKFFLETRSGPKDTSPPSPFPKLKEVGTQKAHQQPRQQITKTHLRGSGDHHYFSAYYQGSK